MQITPALNGQDYIVLNSVSNLSKALRPLGDYERIHCFLDNDRAGLEALREIQREYGSRVRDASPVYSGYKDLNDYLNGKKLSQQVNPVQQAKQVQWVQQPGKKKGKGIGM